MQTVTIAAVEAGVPALVEAREIIAAFHVMIRKRAHDSLDPWITWAKTSLVSSFANGIGKDRGAVPDYPEHCSPGISGYDFHN